MKISRLQRKEKSLVLDYILCLLTSYVIALYRHKNSKIRNCSNFYSCLYNCLVCLTIPYYRHYRVTLNCDDAVSQAVKAWLSLNYFLPGRVAVQQVQHDGEEGGQALWLSLWPWTLQRMSKQIVWSSQEVLLLYLTSQVIHHTDNSVVENKYSNTKLMLLLSLEPRTLSDDGDKAVAETLVRICPISQLTQGQAWPVCHTKPSAVLMLDVCNI